MKPSLYHLFETPLGWCAIGWSESGDIPHVTSFWLPEATREGTGARVAARCGSHSPSATPAEIAEVIHRVLWHLEGKIQDFRNVEVDLSGISPFPRRVLELTRQIPAGETRTYGELARVLGQPYAARAVGQALGRNPIPLIIPCHRVLAAGGKPGGFSAPGGRATKARLLALEGPAAGRWHAQLFLSLPH
jgi:O-6-methylguanine DNA methyltransferase